MTTFRSLPETVPSTSTGIVARDRIEQPFFSICVPQFNRTSFLLRAIESWCEQSFDSFELCISDGGSTDGRHQEIIDFLEQSPLSFRFRRSERNLQYDPNLRASLKLARGRYCMLFGNDDMLASNEGLAFMHERIVKNNFPAAVITNFAIIATGANDRRIRASGILGAGVPAAIAHFRNYNFVSGICLDRESVQRLETDKWDGSEMYQMFLGTRLLAEGGKLLGIEEAVVAKDILIPGEVSEGHYAKKPKVRDFWIKARPMPLTLYAQVACDAVLPCVEENQRQATIRSVFKRVLLFTYPPWLPEYRRVQSWKFAAGIALGMSPRRIIGPLAVSGGTRLYIVLLYLLVTLAGLLVPVALFDRLRSSLYSVAKRT